MCIRSVEGDHARGALATRRLRANARTVAQAQGYPSNVQLRSAGDARRRSRRLRSRSRPTAKACRPARAITPPARRCTRPTCAPAMAQTCKGVARTARHAVRRGAAPDRRPRHADLQKPGDDGRKLLALRHDAVRLHAPRDAVHGAGLADAPTRSTRCPPTSWPKAKIIDKATVLDAATLARCRCPTATASFPIRGLNCSSSVRRDTAVPCWISLAHSPTPSSGSNAATGTIAMARWATGG